MRRLLLVLLLVAGATLLARGAFPCAAISLQPSCYVALRPGPTANTLELVSVEDAQSFGSTGELVLTTVAVDVELDLDAWVRGALSRHIQQVPRDALFTPDADREDISERNTAQMVGSQATATLAALRALDYDVEATFNGAEVFEIADHTAVEGDAIQVGDVIVAIDGQEIRDNEEAIEILAGYEPGDTVTFTVERGSEQLEVPIELIEAADEPGKAQVGVTLVSHLDLPVEVDIDAGAIGGPSAGLMFSLSIVELLDDEDLTGGRVIAGTGAIDEEGRVGAIGGIQQKVLGALERGADERPASVFLVPEGNLVEARAAPVSREVLLVPVATLDDALTALEDLREGKEPDDALALGPG